MQHDDDRYRENLRLRAKGERMPENREQFEHMAKQYERALLDAKETNSRLRSQVSNLSQRVASQGRRMGEILHGINTIYNKFT